jgi:hypothetical protein
LRAGLEVVLGRVRLWFTDGPNKIGAMTTAGVVTEYAICEG